MSVSQVRMNLYGHYAGGVANATADVINKLRTSYMTFSLSFKHVFLLYLILNSLNIPFDHNIGFTIYLIKNEFPVSLNLTTF